MTKYPQRLKQLYSSVSFAPRGTLLCIWTETVSHRTTLVVMAQERTWSCWQLYCNCRICNKSFYRVVIL